jgi:hypothetical protein
MVVCVVDGVEHVVEHATFDSIEEKLSFVQQEGLMQCGGEDGDVTMMLRMEKRGWRGGRGEDRRVDGSVDGGCCW